MVSAGAAETAGGVGGVVLTVSAGVTAVTETVVSSVFSGSVSSDSEVSDPAASEVLRELSDSEESESDSSGKFSDTVSEEVVSLFDDSNAVVITSTSSVEEQETKERSIAGIISEAMIFLVLFFIVNYPFQKIWGDRKTFIFCLKI